MTPKKKAAATKPAADAPPPLNTVAEALDAVNVVSCIKCGAKYEEGQDWMSWLYLHGPEGPHTPPEV